VWKLDRLGRSLKHLIETVNGLAARKVGFQSLRESMDTTTSGGKLIFRVFGAFAEFERELIRERTQAGLRAARARGRNGGRLQSWAPPLPEIRWQVWILRPTPNAGAVSIHQSPNDDRPGHVLRGYLGQRDAQSEPRHLHYQGKHHRGLWVAGQGTISGNGVTVYYETGTVNFAGGATVNLSAPTRGTWQGVLMFQARRNTQAASLVGGSNQLTSGILYFPNAHFNYKGGSSSTTQNATIVSDTLNLVGNSYFSAAATSP